jgi:hypothetical protein
LTEGNPKTGKWSNLSHLKASFLEKILQPILGVSIEISWLFQMLEHSRTDCRIKGSGISRNIIGRAKKIDIGLMVKSHLMIHANMLIAKQ